jgi:hypothetical protein
VQWGRPIHPYTMLQGPFLEAAYFAYCAFLQAACCTHHLEGLPVCVDWSSAMTQVHLQGGETKLGGSDLCAMVCFWCVPDK